MDLNPDKQKVEEKNSENQQMEKCVFVYFTLFTLFTFTIMPVYVYILNLGPLLEFGERGVCDSRNVFHRGYNFECPRRPQHKCGK